jgi:NAD+ synthase
MREKIVKWIKREFLKAKSRGIVLGLSGGVDSGLVATLAKEAVGKSRVLGLILPIHSHPDDTRDAVIIAKKLGIKIKIVNLTKIYDNLLKVLPGANNLAKANLKPRLRMLALYYFANRLNYLVCGAGNKSEFMTGYFTKYGDGAADIFPIAGLLKKQVRTLAQELGLPKRIIYKTPTAGLWPGQTDEDEMGITYPELDDILGRLEKRRRQILPQAKVNKVRKLIKDSGHKRIKPKICII